MIKSVQLLPIYNDTGRQYTDIAGENPHFRIEPLPSNDWAGQPALFHVTYNGATLSQPIWYSHLGLLKLCKHFSFKSVLDLGSGEGFVANVFAHIGKKVTALEPFMLKHPMVAGMQLRPPDIERPYEEVRFLKKFDAIWCSHVLEHVRNPGLFLDKIFDDLKEGGILAITVPFNEFSNESYTNLVLGHHNRYNHWLLLYQLVCAGFDCRQACVAVYAGMVTVIVRKTTNNLPRTATALFAPYPSASGRHDDSEWFHDHRIYDFFPFQWHATTFDHPALRVNWGNPI